MVEERERHSLRDKDVVMIVRRANRETEDRYTDRQTDIYIDGRIYRPTDREIGRQTDGRMDGRTVRHT